MKLKEWRTMRGMTQDEAAMFLGTTTLSYGRWERGEVIPNKKHREFISKATDGNVSIKDIVE